MSTDLDVSSDLSGAYVKRADVEAHPMAFTIAGVARETFEARDGKPAQTRIVLTSNTTPPRKFSLNKVNLRTLVNAWGRKTGPWIGQTFWIYFDPTIEMGGTVKGGQRIRLTSEATSAPSADVQRLQAEIARLKAQVAHDHQPDDAITAAMPTLDESNVL